MLKTSLRKAKNKTSTFFKDVRVMILSAYFVGLYMTGLYTEFTHEFPAFFSLEGWDITSIPPASLIAYGLMLTPALIFYSVIWNNAQKASGDLHTLHNTLPAYEINKAIALRKFPNYTIKGKKGSTWQLITDKLPRENARVYAITDDNGSGQPFIAQYRDEQWYEWHTGKQLHSPIITWIDFPPHPLWLFAEQNYQIKASKFAEDRSCNQFISEPITYVEALRRKRKITDYPIIKIEKM